MAEESGYLVEFLRKKGFSETRKTRHEHLSYCGLDQEYVYVLVSGVVKTCEGGSLITLDMTNEDIAQLCGISSRSSVNRILRGFREKGIVSMRERGTRIVINEKERLERYVMG